MAKWAVQSKAPSSFLKPFLSHTNHWCLIKRLQWFVWLYSFGQTPFWGQSNARLLPQLKVLSCALWESALGSKISTAAAVEKKCVNSQTDRRGVILPCCQQEWEGISMRAGVLCVRTLWSLWFCCVSPWFVTLGRNTVTVTYFRHKQKVRRRQTIW